MANLRLWRRLFVQETTVGKQRPAHRNGEQAERGVRAHRKGGNGDVLSKPAKKQQRQPKPNPIVTTSTSDPSQQQQPKPTTALATRTRLATAIKTQRHDTAPATRTRIILRILCPRCLFTPLHATHRLPNRSPTRLALRQQPLPRRAGTELPAERARLETPATSPGAFATSVAVVDELVVCVFAGIGDGMRRFLRCCMLYSAWLAEIATQPIYRPQDAPFLVTPQFVCIRTYVTYIVANANIQVSCPPRKGACQSVLTYLSIQQAKADPSRN